MVIVQQFCLPIKCNHETPYYDELRGEDDLYAMRKGSN